MIDGNTITNAIFSVMAKYYRDTGKPAEDLIDVVVRGNPQFARACIVEQLDRMIAHGRLVTTIARGNRIVWGTKI